MPLKNKLIFLGFAPVIWPIALGLGLRDRPWTFDNVRDEIVRLYDCYVYACERDTR